MVMEEKPWAGIDVGKGLHWAHVVDDSGTELLSRRVDNDEADPLALIDEVLSQHRGRASLQGVLFPYSEALQG